ncbi:hypothetical protein [Phascolarctobacterium sp.]|uniref:hypothetical protein n=1 Tax=Phascolarctobacterium sp. TaxID=2049039 RepID=UPI00386456AB
MSTNRFFNAKELIVKNGGPLPISLSAVYAGIKDGTIPVVTMGKRKLIPKWYIDSLIQKGKYA